MVILYIYSTSWCMKLVFYECQQLHHLSLNAIIEIRKFICAVTSCGSHPTANVFAQHYELHYQNKKKKIHLEGCETTLAAQFGDRLPSL
jgi:hypothetical protein